MGCVARFTRQRLPSARPCRRPTFGASASLLKRTYSSSCCSHRRNGTKAWQEISGSKSWLEDNTGCSCLLFCPPKGRYAGHHLAMIRRAGFLGLRSAELISLDFPRRQAELLLMPTILQAYPHRVLTFAKN